MATAGLALSCGPVPLVGNDGPAPDDTIIVPQVAGQQDAAGDTPAGNDRPDGGGFPPFEYPPITGPGDSGPGGGVDPGDGDADTDPPDDPPDAPPANPDDPPPPPEHLWIRGRLLGAGDRRNVVIRDGAGTALTATEADGAFAVRVPYEWSGQVVPDDVRFSMSPASVSLESLQSDTNLEFDLFARHPEIPMFAVRRTSDGGLVRFARPSALPADAPFAYDEMYDTPEFQARVRWMGDDGWRLDLSLKVAASEVWFPLELGRQTIGASSDDDVLMTPRLCGDAVRSDALSDSLKGPLYPGDAFAPLVVHGDATRARMVAAINWPPRPVIPVFARGRIGILYKGAQLPAVNGPAQSYRLLSVSSSGDPAVGVHAWHRCVDAYREWLVQHATAEGLFPIPYPDWLQDSQGWLTMSLPGFADSTQFDGPVFRGFWDKWKHWFPWVQFWGQMSPHGGNCCVEDPNFHARYLPAVTNLTAYVRADGGHVGYYSRIRDPYPPIDGLDAASTAELQKLLDWFAHNTNHNANAYYIDIIGGQYVGDPLTVAKLFRDVFPETVAIEYPVDLYPTSLYIANCIYGNGLIGAGPGQTDCMNCFEDNPVVGFPSFGRYLMEDRVMFLGIGNGGIQRWGAANDHWQERQVFLLGTKIDANYFTIEEPYLSGNMNPALAAIVAEREASGFWTRRPRYRHLDGVHDIPPGIEVRRFEGTSGESLFAIDNWSQSPGQTFRFRGQPVEIPERKLSIVVLEAP